MCVLLAAAESLVDVKKQRLLLSLQGMDSCAAQMEEDVEEEAVEAEEEEERKEEVEEDDLRGVRCRAPVKEVGHSNQGSMFFLLVHPPLSLLNSLRHIYHPLLDG